MLEDAVQYYEKVLNIDSNDQSALNNLGACLIHLSRAQEGIRHLQLLVKLHPNSVAPYVNMGVHWMEEGSQTSKYPLI